MMLYPSFGVGRARLPPRRRSRGAHLRRDPRRRRRRRGDRAVGRRQVAPRSLPRDQPRTGGLERRDVEVYNPARIGSPGRSTDEARRVHVRCVSSARSRSRRLRSPRPPRPQRKAPPRRTPSRAAAAPPPSPELVKARMRPPGQGTAYIEVIKGRPRWSAANLQNVHKVKNMSDVADRRAARRRVLLHRPEGSRGRQRQACARPIAPGEIAEIADAPPSSSRASPTAS